MRPPRLAIQTIAGGTCLALVAGAAAYFVFTDSAPPEVPALSAAIKRGTIRVGKLERSYLFYVPANIAANPALIFVLHGARGTGQRMRVQTAYEFESLADRNNFVVIYPDGFERYWNDCRKSGAFSAETLKVDDVGFIHALIQRFRAQVGIAPSHVFAMGFSNGGQMAYRLALELADEISGVAAVAANLPTAENWECRAAERPVAVMIVNGTADPINPYAGGRVGWFGFRGGGGVRSTSETATYFTGAAGDHSAPALYRYPKVDDNADVWVERATWDAAGSPEVRLYTIHGGGHTIPQAKYRQRRILGPTATDIDCMQEIWEFFDRQMQRDGAGRAVPQGQP